MRIDGRAVVVGDDVDTDLIFPARYLAVLDRREQAKHVFEPLGPEMREKVARNPILVAGWNMGCGSSREHAVTALIGAGTRLIVAKSFARIFFRNAINSGLPVIESPELAGAIADNDRVEADLARGESWINGRPFRFTPLPDYLLSILAAGGLWARFRAQSVCAGT